MKVSVSSYSFAQYIREGKMTQLDTVAKAKELGFDAIEFTDIDGKGNYELQLENARKLRAEADRLGMKINAYTIGANLFNETEEQNEAEVERLCRQVNIAKILGADVMRHDVCYALGKTGNSRSFDLMLPTIARLARRVTEYAATVGVKTCTENHGFIAQDSDRVERLFNAVAHDNYGLLVDMGNFVCADEDSALAVSRVAPYAIHAHIKDMRVHNEKNASVHGMTRGGRYFECCVVGEGHVPVKRCIRILKRAGYDGFVSLEYEGREDCIDGIKRSLANIKRFLDEECV